MFISNRLVITLLVFIIKSIWLYNTIWFTKARNSGREKERNLFTMFVVNECTFTGYNPLSLDLAYLIAILLGILVIITKNPVISVLFLIGLFLTISCYLILIGLNFIGLSYLLVYIGAVSILFLFIVMLINVRISELPMDTINSIPLGLFIWFEENMCLSTNLGIDNKPIQIYIPLPGIEFFVAIGIGMAGYHMCKMLPKEERNIRKVQIEARYFIVYENGLELRIFAHIDPNDPYGYSLRLLHMYNSNVKFINVIMYNRRWLAVCGTQAWSDLAIDDLNWNDIQNMVHATNDIFQPFLSPIMCIYAPDLNHRRMLETELNLEYVTGFVPYQIPLIDCLDQQRIPLIGVRLCSWSVLQPVVLCPEFL